MTRAAIGIDPGKDGGTPEQVLLDLSDPAGMDLAARWLAAHHGLTVGATAPAWWRQATEAGAWWDLCGPDDDLSFAGGLGAAKLYYGIGVPGISAITDTAAALALACLAAAGRTT